MPEYSTTQESQTVQTVMNQARAGELADLLRRCALGDILAALAKPDTRSGTGDLSIGTNTVTFLEPVLAILGGTATVNAKNLPIALVPPGSAVGAIEGTSPSPHTCTVAVDATSGLIVSVTFSGVPTIPFFLVIPAINNDLTTVLAEQAATE